MATTTDLEKLVINYLIQDLNEVFFIVQNLYSSPLFSTYKWKNIYVQF